MNLGDFYQSISVGGNEKQEWEGTVLSELGKGSERGLFLNVPKEHNSERFFYYSERIGSCDVQYVTQRQLMRLFAVKFILSYEQKCKVRSKFLKN